MTKKTKKRGSYEKPLKLDMDFDEAMQRLTNVSKEDLDREMEKDKDKPRESKKEK